MSTPDRTWPECLDVPSHVMQRLRVAARADLQRACDNGGAWDEEIAQRVLDVASVVLAFDIMSLPPGQVATLAHGAVRLEIEGLLASPSEMQDSDAVITRLAICRELMELRDAALGRAGEISGRDAA